MILEGTAKVLALANRQTHCGIIYPSSEEAYRTPVLTTPADVTFVGAIDSSNVRNCYPFGKKTAERLASMDDIYVIDIKRFIYGKENRYTCFLWLLSMRKRRKNV